MLTLFPSEIGNAETAAWLQAAIAPRPICFASTVSAAGVVNLSPFSFFNMFSSSPAIVVFSPAISGRTGLKKHTLLNIEEVPEVCINIVTHAMVQQVSLSSTEFERGVDEFVKAGFTALPSIGIRPPRVAQSPVQMECRVRQIVSMGDNRGAGQLVVAEVERFHVSHDVIGADGKPDVHKLDLVARLGGDWYTRSAPGLFQVEKPLRTLGMGVDALPMPVRQSRVLTGNDLGRLGNSEVLPTTEQLSHAEGQILAKLAHATDEAVHRLAQKALEEVGAGAALALLFAHHGHGDVRG